MLLNITNHPLPEWTSEQIEQGKRIYGDIVDIPFPPVAPHCDEQDILRLAQETFASCRKWLENSSEKVVILIMGEMTLTYALVRLFQSHGYPCVATVTDRKYKLNGTGFVFLGFRPYPVL